MKKYVIVHVSIWDYELDINLVDCASFNEAQSTLYKMYDEELKLFLERYHIDDIEINEYDDMIDISYKGYGCQYSSYLKIECI